MVVAKHLINVVLFLYFYTNIQDIERLWINKIAVWKKKITLIISKVYHNRNYNV